MKATCNTAAFAGIFSGMCLFVSSFFEDQLKGAWIFLPAVLALAPAYPFVFGKDGGTLTLFPSKAEVQRFFETGKRALAWFLGVCCFSGPATLVMMAVDGLRY